MQNITFQLQLSHYQHFVSTLQSKNIIILVILPSGLTLCIFKRFETNIFVVCHYSNLYFKSVIIVGHHNNSSTVYGNFSIVIKFGGDWLGKEIVNKGENFIK